MPVLFNLLWLTEFLILKDFRNLLFLAMLDTDQAQFLKEDDIQKMNVRAVTFLFGCLSVTQ